MWIKIDNKFINLDTGIYIEKSENIVEKLIAIELKSLNSDKKVILYSNSNAKKVNSLFETVIREIREQI